MVRLSILLKARWGLLLVTLLSGGYSLAVELYVGSSAYNTTVHVVSNALAVALGYPLGTWAARRYGGRMSARLGGQADDSSQAAVGSRVAVAIAVAGRIFATVSVVSIAVSATLASVLAIGGLPVAEVSLQWIAGSAIAFGVGGTAEVAALALTSSAATRGSTRDMLTELRQFVEEAEANLRL